MNKRIVLPLLLITFIFFSAAQPALAQESTPPGPVPIPPLPPEWSFDDLRIAYQKVNVLIENQVATTRIDQLFVNESDRLLEGIYLFPLPAGAAVSELTMWVNGDPVSAKLLEAEEAREIYDQIVRELRDPALLEYVGSQAIQANIFPIPPNDERRIEIEYSQILPAENGLVYYIYPQSTELYTNTPLDTQTISLEVRSNETIRTIYSPSHLVDIVRDGPFKASVGYEANNTVQNQDFELYYSMTPEDIGLNLISFKESDSDGFFLLLIAPSSEIDPDSVVAKDVIIVLDTSGSMEGEKIRQAKKAAAFVVENLHPEDRFNIISFSTGTRNYSRQMLPAVDPGDYKSFIDNLEAIGGTNISQALLEASGQASQERPTTVIFLTDGLATEGIVDSPLLLESVKNQTSENVRIFAFGVGNDVDTFLLDSLVQNHGGTTTYVRPGQQIDESVSAFYAKISTPVLANIEIDFDEIVVEQIYPGKLPDLFAGTQLVVTGRYRQGGPAKITLTGELNGQEQVFIYEDNVFRSSGGDDFIPRLWATRAIGNLLTQIRLQGEDAELVQSVINLSLRYGLITPYTSYLIEEEDIFSEAGRQDVLEESMKVFAAPAEVSGAVAVDKAAEEAIMMEAEAPLAPARAASIKIGDGSTANVSDVLQMIGNKTFILRDGQWIDTGFDPDRHNVEEIGFASAAYFDLLRATPELSRFLALDRHMLVVYDGKAYRIVEENGVLKTDDETELDDGSESDLPIQTQAETDPALSDDEDGLEEKGSGNCAPALIAPIFLIGLSVFFNRRRFRLPG